MRDFRETLVVRGIAQGSVQADKTVSVNFMGTIIRCRAGRSVTTAAGDVVLGMRSKNEIVIIERLHAAAPGSDPLGDSQFPPNQWPSIQSGQTVIHPVETRSYRDSLGWRKDTDDLLQGAWGGHNHAGCAFYSKKPRSLAGAEVLKAWIKVKRDAGSQWSTHEPTTLKRITQKTLTHKMIKDGTGPDFVSGAIDGPRLSRGESENFVIPNSWGQDLVDGDSGGLAVHTNTEDPKARLDGRHSWAPSFTLTIRWQRVI